MSEDRIARLENELRSGRMDRRSFILGALGAGATVASALTAADRAAAQTPRRGGRLRMGLGHGSTSDSLDPALFNSGFTLNTANSFGNQLTEIAPDGRLIGELAESWETNADASVWRFKLRRGVEFHNGKTLRPEDVIASYRHHIGPDSRSGARGLIEQVETFAKDGDDTIVFTLKSGNADFPYLCSEYRIVILPERDGRLDWAESRGTGPYILTSFQPGVRALLRRNPNYWKSGRGHFDEVEIISLVDGAARQNALLTGAVDVIDKVELRTANRLAQRSGLKLVEVTGTLHYYFAANTQAAPFNNLDFRLAIKHAMNRQDMLEKVLFGHGKLGNDHPISPANRFFDPNLAQREIDLDRARFHFERSGVGRTAVNLSVSDAAWIGSDTAGVILKESAARIGMNINVVREPSDGYWVNVSRRVPWFASYSGGRATEDWVFSLFFARDARFNETNFDHEDFMKLLLAARIETDEAKRRTMYGEMQRIVRDDGGAVIPLFANHVMAMSARVQQGPRIAGNWEMDGGKASERWWFG